MRKFPMVLFAFLLFSFTYLFTDVFEDNIIKARNLLEQGYNKWDESKMQESLAQFQRLLHLEKDEWLVYFYIAFADYRLGTYYMDKDKEKAGKYFDNAIDQLKKSQELNDSFPESHFLCTP